MDTQARIYVAGHNGLVGSAIVRRLEAEGFANILTASRQQLDLRDQAEVTTGSAPTVPSTCSSWPAPSVGSWPASTRPRSSSTTT